MRAWIQRSGDQPVRHYRVSSQAALCGSVWRGVGMTPRLWSRCACRQCGDVKHDVGRIVNNVILTVGRALAEAPDRLPHRRELRQGKGDLEVNSLIESRNTKLEAGKKVSTYTIRRHESTFSKVY